MVRLAEGLYPISWRGVYPLAYNTRPAVLDAGEKRKNQATRSPGYGVKKMLTF